MKNINPNDYDFIFKVGGIPYFFTSYWLIENYRKIDCIVTTKNKTWKVYISKKDRKKLSEIGLKLFESGMPKFRKKTNDLLVKAEAYFSMIEKKDLTKYSDKELAEDFEKFLMFTQKIWSLFFYTEFFMHDKVQEKLEKENNEKLAKVAKEMGGLKWSIRTLINKTGIEENNLIGKYFDEISKRIEIQDLEEYHYKEIIELLNGKKVEKKNRKIFVLAKFNDWKDILGEDALKLIDLLDSKYSYDIDVLKGSGTSKGFYKGKVKIIPFDIEADLAKKIEEMDKGDVLVTGSTGPEMILACHKAGAIVTEEGGICSHAAIVSRELGIPCVVGTKIATNVLKDGDLVEVDANKGVVRKLK